MRRVAVFGNAGGGKSRLAAKIAALTGLPLHVIDKMQFKPGGDGISPEDYLSAHSALLNEDTWVIDGYGTTATAFERFERADTLVYVDLPRVTHYWFVTKRFVNGLFAAPAGWPAGSPLWSSTLQSYKVIPLCHRHLTPKYRRLVADAAEMKRVHHLTSRAEIAAFLEAVKKERSGR